VITTAHAFSLVRQFPSREIHIVAEDGDRLAVDGVSTWTSWRSAHLALEAVLIPGDKVKGRAIALRGKLTKGANRAQRRSVGVAR
jgi:hypothetical protein